MNEVTTYAQQLQTLAVLYLPRLFMALLALGVGWWAVGRVGHIMSLATTRLDVSLRSFLSSLVNIVLKVLLLITVAGMVGFETTSFVAVLGAAGLAVGVTWPMVLHFGSQVPGDLLSDRDQNLWNLWWVKWALLDHPTNPYHTPLLYYPDGVDLYAHTLALPNGLIGLIPQVLSGLPAAWVVAGTACALLVGAASGLLNGLLIARLRLTPILATIGTG